MTTWTVVFFLSFSRFIAVLKSCFALHRSLRRGNTCNQAREMCAFILNNHLMALCAHYSLNFCLHAIFGLYPHQNAFPNSLFPLRVPSCLFKQIIQSVWRLRLVPIFHLNAQPDLLLDPGLFSNYLTRNLRNPCFRTESLDLSIKRKMTPNIEKSGYNNFKWIQNGTPKFTIIMN